MASLSTLASPPQLSFTATTPQTLRDEAKETKDRFSHAIKATGGCNSRADAFASLSLALGEASAASVRATLPSMVHGEADVRSASHAAKDDFKSMFDEALSDAELYKSLLSFGRDDVVAESEEHTDEDDRFQRNVLRTMRRNGCGLESAAARSTVQAKRRLIEETCTAFCSAINEHDKTLLFTDQELNGVDDLDRFPKDETTGKRKISLKAPDTMPILKFATNPHTRKIVTEASSRKCQVENTSRFLEVLKLRHECATLLGYKSHAQYMCETKMVGTPEKAEEFLLELADAYKPVCKKELELLLEMKQKDVNAIPGSNGADDGNMALDSWDILHYTQLYKAEFAGVDEAALRRYFPLEHVKSTILDIYEQLLGLKFDRVIDAQVWHEDVECYAVKSTSSGDGEVLGHFYFDIYPRKGKYSHQCVYPLQPSYVRDTANGSERVLPACVNIGNLTPSREGSPSMLMFREVETFFHEFGHVCHCILTNSRHSFHSWAWSAVPWPGGVEQDFLEVPSMMLENFVWCPEVLRRLSKHESDGSCLPESTIDALSKSRFLMLGYQKCKYLAMALYDLKVHGGPGPYSFDGKEYDAVSLYNAMVEKYSGIAPISETFSAASWFHLMMGYDAGYYGYIYSETFAADLFGEFGRLSFENKSVIDAGLGKKYRDFILSPGATIDGDMMLRNFLEREPSKEAFLSHI